MEFVPDDTFVDHPLGRGDAPDAVPGRRRLVSDRHIALTFGGARPDRELEIPHTEDRKGTCSPTPIGLLGCVDPGQEVVPRRDR
jgi:hypothetical protein